MNRAICFNCGFMKTGPLAVCGTCQRVPTDRSQQIISIALSQQFFNYTELLINGTLIKAHISPKIEKEILLKARQALDSQEAVTSTLVTPASISKRGESAQASSISRNPFAILRVSVRDGREKIVELAEERSLVADSEVCLQARSELTNPRKRIAAEISWLPGVSPKKAIEFVDRLEHDPGFAYQLDSLPPLANCNLLASGLELIDPSTPSNFYVHWILKLAEAEHSIDLDDVIRDINEDRAIAGFSAIRNSDDVASEISARREHFKRVVLDALDDLSSVPLVEVMTGVIQLATNDGKAHAPVLVDEVVDSYRSRVEGLLERESHAIQELIGEIEEKAGEGESAILPLLEDLDRKVRRWDQLAQPIQLSYESRGMDHELSHKIARAVRSMAVDLVNEHEMIETIKPILSMMDEIFAELPSVVDQLDDDKTALENLEKQKLDYEKRQRESEREAQEYIESLRFSADIGVVFKDRLSISPAGVTWKNRTYALDSITRVRWGAIQHSVNGIPTGTEYKITFGDDRDLTTCSLKNSQIYEQFLEKFWPAVCVGLLIRSLQDLKEGKKLAIGGFRVSDEGIELTKHRFLSSEISYHTWDQVSVWNANGSFVVGSSSDNKTYQTFSYLDDDNTHILEHIVRAKFQKPGRLLSDILS